jgi:aerobic-type carbon monoxide dehydrogenase small subunit (CoxS/CutS family)
MVKLRVNGQEQSFDGDPSMPLLWYLRDEFGAYGNKIWVRRGAVRRLHRPRGRCSHASLHHSCN